MLGGYFDVHSISLFPLPPSFQMELECVSSYRALNPFLLGVFEQLHNHTMEAIDHSFLLGNFFLLLGLQVSVRFQLMS